MLKVCVPKNNVPERRYIADVLLSDFLGLEYLFESSEEQDDWSIFLENGNSIVIRDAFFSKHKESLSYLAQNNIPSDVEFCELPFTPESDLPVLFGKGELSISHSSITCEVDIFAGAFFMLTRWEEYVNKARDAHDRFPAAESLAFKYGFLERPIVNEYVEFFWTLLTRLGYLGARKERSFTIVPTHDVDSTFFWRDSGFVVKTLAGDILKRKSLTQFWYNFIEILKVGLSSAKDRFDTFDELMAISEGADVKSHFFFMSGGNSKYDNAYEIESRKTKRLIKSIKERGHYIGIHPSYNSYLDADMLEKEIARLAFVSEQEIVHGRHHVLRYDVAITPTLWNELNMKWDSTLGYAEHNGFRAGVCYPFSMYDFLRRKKLCLTQKPLVFMEVTDFKYRSLTLAQALNATNNLLSVVKKYNGEFVCLWHNSNIYGVTWRERFHQIYKMILSSSK
ncbi:MAG: polysaccharide deacetylase family protein [Oleiphilaceae bacterium]|nr:polysaccharide deacetylase family protein [Oleiphilaceae bacterium]